MSLGNLINTVSEILTLPYNFSPINIYASQLFIEIYGPTEPVNNQNMHETINYSNNVFNRWERLPSSELNDESSMLEPLNYNSLSFETLSTNDIT
mgnify:CR=1 FL=1